MEKFYSSTDIRPFYNELAETYRSAFAGPPWFERGKCVDPASRCASGFSATGPGLTCGTCSEQVVDPAYSTTYLTELFASYESKNSSWYTEQFSGRIALAAVAYATTPDTIAENKYSDDTMQDWIETNIVSPIIWLDEVFADLQARPRGNLRNFGSFVCGMMAQLDVPTLAFRTINPAMLRASERDFGKNATILKRKLDVPDWRDFAIIDGSAK